MTDQQWRQTWEIYRAASELPDDQRRSYLASLSGDPEVFQEVVLFLEERAEELAELPIGAKIGRYEILGKLGRGGMGQVYSARDPELGRALALKLLAPEWIANPAAMERLIREARAASALNHPHIVTVYEVVRSGDSIAIAMELVEGNPLRSYCGKPQPVAQVIRWGRQMAQALAAAHARNIVHRDIKPDNVMVRADGYVKLLDFGLAHQLAAEEQNLAGTLNYMAPEQARAEPATSASDVFSLGVVLFELATGVHPFPAGSPIDTVRAIAHNAPKPPKSLNREVPPALNALLLAMLAKLPRDRPSAAEVDRKLAAMEQAGVEPHPRGFSWLVAALAACIIFALILVLMHGRIRAPKEPVLSQLTRQASENRITAAALSPDGANLAFATFAGTVHLRRMNDGFTRTLQAPAELQVERIAWFAYGSRILLSGTQANQRGGVWVIPVNGGPPRLIVPDGKDAVPSPDGTRIAFTSLEGSTILVAGADGTRIHPIRAGTTTQSLFSALLWSPDSKRIAYERQDYSPTNGRAGPNPDPILKNYEFSYESADASTGQIISSIKHVFMTSACGLSDGRVLFLQWIAPFKHQLWEIRTDPRSGRILGPPLRLTHTVESLDTELFSVSASANGKQVVVVRKTLQRNLYVADVLSGGPVPRLSDIRRFSFSDADDFPHAWTHDSLGVIFESNRTGTYQLYRQELTQTDPEPLTAVPGDHFLPQLSPDGKWILYRWDEPGKGRVLMRVGANGGDSKPVPIRGKLDEFRCAVQSGGCCVLRTTANGQFIFHELDPVRGEGRELARTAWSPTLTGDWDLSPDGSEIAIPNHDPHEARIRVIALRGHTESTITLNGPKYLSAIAWSPDGQGWYVSARAGSEMSLLYANLHGQTWELLKSARPSFVVPSPDGRHVVFPQDIASSNVWLVSGLNRQ
jgi:eukaryotic-like serine/threonine-protein kinase